jgi:glycosyltransferase involved in cell wall biosynthesis
MIGWFGNITIIRSNYLSNTSIGRPTRYLENELAVSIIIPVCNEAGNLPALFERMPIFGKTIELIFIEGHSKDHSSQILEDQIREHPEFVCRLFKQPGKGKADAVFLGLDQAKGDILIIFDADLSVDPEVLPKVYRLIAQEKGDLIIGNRLDSPASKGAMPLLNLLANRFFARLISKLFRKHITDTLCGLKAIRKSHYQSMCKAGVINRDLDPFGDFFLLLSATKLGFQITEFPVQYRERSYGKSKIYPLFDGLKLIKLIFLFYHQEKNQQGLGKE